MEMTREELHAEVWSQPMRTLAKSMGISDVALAKRCKAADIPVPPRGWWARKAAGKPVKVEPLPTPRFALSNYFPALAPSAAEPERVSGPAPPAFRDLAAVQAEIRSAVRPVKVPPGLETPHPLVARLLKQDANRKAAPPVRSYFQDRDAKRFESPIQQRRLRILSAILTEFERLGCKANGSTHAGERFNINVGGAWTYIFLGIEGGPSASYFYSDRRVPKDRDRERLRFDQTDHNDRDPAKQIWREEARPLEQQATEIVVGVLIRLEEDARGWALLSHKWECEDQERRLKEARLAAEKAEADRIAREKAEAAARIAALVDGADALERAARIRRYVQAARDASWEDNDRSREVVERWAAWALAEADAIDPIVSRRLLSSIGP